MKVKHYGDLIAKVTGKPLLSYVEFGSYTGSYIAALDDNENVELWTGHYGSCSGCDFLEAEDVESEGKWMQDDPMYSIPDDKIAEYMKDEKSFATIPKETILRVDSEALAAMLPANVRDDLYDFDAVAFSDTIKSSLQST